MTVEGSLGRFAAEVYYRRERRRRLDVYLASRASLLEHHAGSWVALVDDDEFLFAPTYFDVLALISDHDADPALAIVRYLAPRASRLARVR